MGLSESRGGGEWTEESSLALISPPPRLARTLLCGKSVYLHDINDDSDGRADQHDRGVEFEVGMNHTQHCQVHEDGRHDPYQQHRAESSNYFRSVKAKRHSVGRLFRYRFVPRGERRRREKVAD